MKAAKKKTPAPSPFAPLEALEDRKLLATYWPDFVRMNAVFTQYPWLDGDGHGVAVIDKGIDYLHPRLGGNPTTGTPSPWVVNVHDWQDGDNDPFPDEVDPTDPDPAIGHATGVAGILTMLPYRNPSDGKMYQGLLQNATLYNLRESDDDSQGSITAALQWVVDHHAEYNITAINLTDFYGTTASTPLYDAQVKKLWDAGVFVATPVANNWLGDPDSGTPAHTQIGFPGKSPYVFATGGLSADGLGVRAETQRGPLLDLLAPAVGVWLPYYNATKDSHDWVPGEGNSWGLPMIVGTAVMIQQIDPTVTPAEVMKILQDSGVTVNDTDANFALTGVRSYKRLDVLNAVKLAYQVRDDAADQNGGNDSLATAATIALDSTGKGSLAGQKLLIHDHDYYTFSVSAAGLYSVSAIEGAQLLDANGNLVATVGAGGTLSRSLAAGKYYVHLYDEAEALDGAYALTIARHPSVLPATFSATPNEITVAFSANVGASLVPGDLAVTPRAGGATIVPTSVSFNATTNTARFVFATPLPDGDYRATIAASNVTDSGSRVLDGNLDATFFALMGDANRDRAVGFADLLALAKNYGGNGKTWAEGDFTGDGKVDFADLLTLAKKYNTSLPAPASPADTFVTATAATTMVRDDAAAQPVFSTTRVAPPTPAAAKPKAAARPPRGGTA